MSLLKKKIDNTTKWFLTILVTASAILLLFYSFQIQFLDDRSVDGKNIFVAMALVNGVSIFVVNWYSFRHVSLQYAWAGIVSLVLMSAAWCLLSLSMLSASAT